MRRLLSFEAARAGVHWDLSDANVELRRDLEDDAFGEELPDFDKAAGLDPDDAPDGPGEGYDPSTSGDISDDIGALARKILRGGVPGVADGDAAGGAGAAGAKGAGAVGEGGDAGAAGVDGDDDPENRSGRAGADVKKLTSAGGAAGPPVQPKLPPRSGTCARPYVPCTDEDTPGLLFRTVDVS